MQRFHLSHLTYVQFVVQGKDKTDCCNKSHGTDLRPRWTGTSGLELQPTKSRRRLRCAEALGLPTAGSWVPGSLDLVAPVSPGALQLE